MDALQDGGFIPHESLSNPVVEMSPFHIRLYAGNNALKDSIRYLFFKTFHQCPDVTPYEPIPEKSVNYTGEARHQDNPYPYTLDDEPVVDENQRWNNGNDVEEVGTQVRSPVPAEPAAGKELNSENDAEPDIKPYPATGHRSLGAEDPGCK